MKMWVKEIRKRICFKLVKRRWMSRFNRRSIRIFQISLPIRRNQLLNNYWNLMWVKSVSRQWKCFLKSSPHLSHSHNPPPPTPHLWMVTLLQQFDPGSHGFLPCFPRRPNSMTRDNLSIPSCPPPPLLVFNCVSGRIAWEEELRENWVQMLENVWEIYSVPSLKVRSSKSCFGQWEGEALSMSIPSHFFWPPRHCWRRMEMGDGGGFWQQWGETYVGNLWRKWTHHSIPIHRNNSGCSICIFTWWKQ